VNSTITKQLVNRPKSKQPLNTLKSNWNRIRFNFQENFHALCGRRIVHFIHIGKTGGTAVKHALGSHATTPAYLIRRHGHQTQLRHIPEGHGVIFFLRDPQERFVSGFYSRLREGRPRFNNPWQPHERFIFERFPTPNNLARGLSSLDNDERGDAEAAMRTISHVRDSYLRWFESEEYFLSRLADIFFIGFQESLNDDFQNLKTKLGLPQTLTLPEDDVLTHRSPSYLDRRLDDEAVRNIRRWYAADFNFLDLCRAYARRINAGLLVGAIINFEAMIPQLLECF
jgi:hypothetical protein